MKLNSKILFLRKREGMSQEDLAEKIDVSRQTVYKWESGAATPEIAKLKQLAKLFNVSFDYLMDDEIEEIESPEKLPLRKIKHRYTYDSKIPMDFFAADLDHGYTERRKRRFLDSDEMFAKRKKRMCDLLTEIGADKVILLQDDLAGCFFENPHEMFFGFYYGGSVQFLCPFENFINAQIIDEGAELVYRKKLIPGFGFGENGLETIGVGSIPVPHLKKASIYRLLISYFDEAGNICEFKLGLNCKRLYTLYEYSDTRKTDTLESIQSDYTRAKLTETLTRLNAYPTVAQRISEGKLTVKELDRASLLERFEAAARQEVEYKKQLEEATLAGNRARTRFWLIILGAFAAVGVLILLGKGLSLLVDNIQDNNRNKDAAAPIEHLIDSIGEVTLEDKDAIFLAEEAYMNLTDAQRKHVKNYDTLLEAKEKFMPLYTAYMEEQTKDDPTRSITVEDLKGTWFCADFYIRIDDYKGYTTILTGTNIQELGIYATKRSVIPVTTFSGAYDCHTQTKKGILTHVIPDGDKIYVERHDFSVYIDENGVLTMQLKGYTFTKGAN